MEDDMSKTIKLKDDAVVVAPPYMGESGPFYIADEAGSNPRTGQVTAGPTLSNI